MNRISALSMAHQEGLSVPIERVGRYLRFRWSFVAPVPVEETRRRLQDYFTRLGYALVASGDALVMKRGTLARSMLKWSPRNLATELTARFAPAGDGTAVTLELQLNRTGHTIYGAELYLHAWELKKAETYLRGEPVDFAAMEDFDRRTLERVYLSIGLGVAITIPIVVLIVVIGRPILSDLGIDRPLRGAILGGLGGGIAGSLVWLFIRVLLNPQKY
jgi:hypothetical protein